MELRRRSTWFLAMGWVLLNAPWGTADELPPDFFADSVRPILVSNCVKCHSGAKPKGGLSLTDRQSLLRGGDSGPAVSVEDPEDSLLLSAIRYESYEMPPSGQLADDAIEHMERWIMAGSPWPEPLSIGDNTVAGSVEPPPPEVSPQDFWAFRPVQRPAPSATTTGRPAAIDRFIDAKLHDAGLTANPTASREVLIRRAYYDLIGLPPTPDDVARFAKDPDPDAFAYLVEELLQSPHYGEKWGRHWLDLVRYAETNSYERDSAKPNAWKYRDYVIKSFNDDKPFDRFIQEQIAGDEMADRTADQIIATGYYRLGVWDDEPADGDLALYDELDDIVSTTSQVFLGLTIHCARCHDHKLDPIPQEDYYRMLAYFAGVHRYGGPNRTGADLRHSQVALAPAEEIEKHKSAMAEFHGRLQAIDQQIQAMESEFQSRLPGGERDDFSYEENRLDVLKRRVPELFTPDEVQQYVELRQKRDQVRAESPVPLDSALAVTELGLSPRETHVLIRGNPHAVGKPVEPGLPRCLDAAAPEVTVPLHQQSCGRRTALANWIASPDNPLTARVMANRVWQYHFGRGIVQSPNNFGYKGDPPTHPELLDWLASELVDSGWSIAHLHRTIMNSAAYQRSSDDEAQALAADPENRLLWRFDMRRLASEEVRDSMLAINGTLNLRMGGPSVFPAIPQEVLAGQSRPGEGWDTSAPAEASRRSVYVFSKRSLVLPILASFDGPEMDTSCPSRFATTQPTQALSMMNGPFIQEQARLLKQRVANTISGDDLQLPVERCLALVTQRTPSAGEIDRGVRFLRESMAHGNTVDEALTAFCVLALNLNEFIYVD